jgi:hypothetical protein
MGNLRQQVQRFLTLRTTPSATWVCFEIMITPIAASMPCTTEGGMRSATAPALNRANRICDYARNHNRGDSALVTGHVIAGS